ncbi:hypothetical protein NHQ30_002668 [Ciborinia camelliae]|nr:hypothetical protein NHQ30_002668 [Ciborinia camelliae]
MADAPAPAKLEVPDRTTNRSTNQNFEAPGNIDPQNPHLSFPNNPNPTFSPYSLQSPASNIPINTNFQQTSFPAPMSLHTRDDASDAAGDEVVALDDPLSLHNGANSTLINDTNFHSAVLGNAIHCEVHGPDTGSAVHTSLTSSEHSSGSDAAFYCSVGSPSEEDMPIDSLFHVSEEEPEFTSTLLRGTTSAPISAAGNVVDSVAVATEEERVEKRGVKGIAQKKLAVARRFFKRLFSRK